LVDVPPGAAESVPVPIPAPIPVPVVTLPVLEPVVAEPVAGSGGTLVSVAAEPVAEPVIEGAKPVSLAVGPVAEPVAEPVTEPVAERLPVVRPKPVATVAVSVPVLDLADPVSVDAESVPGAPPRPVSVALPEAVLVPVALIEFDPLFTDAEPEAVKSYSLTIHADWVHNATNGIPMLVSIAVAGARVPVITSVPSTNRSLLGSADTAWPSTETGAEPGRMVSVLWKTTWVGLTTIFSEAMVKVT